MTNKSVAVIGAGTMGSAVAVALKNNGYSVVATRRTVEKLDDLKTMGMEVSSDNRDAILKSDSVIFSLKPAETVVQMQKMAKELEGKLVISICASLPISKMESLLPKSTVIRAMTNVASRVGGGFTAYCISDKVDKQGEKAALDVLRCFGEVEKIEERYMDALTPISGSGPAYIFTVIEAMVYAGLKVGLPRELALRASYQTILGSAKLVAESGDSLSALKETVITPGGVTIEALYELEDSRITTAFMKAIEAAADKARKSSYEFLNKLDDEEGN